MAYCRKLSQQHYNFGNLEGRHFVTTIFRQFESFCSNHLIILSFLFFGDFKRRQIFKTRNVKEQGIVSPVGGGGSFDITYDITFKNKDAVLLCSQHATKTDCLYRKLVSTDSPSKSSICLLRKTVCMQTFDNLGVF